MRVQSLTLRDFRSYQALRLEGLGMLTVFSGRNAAGKTNLLEALALLTSRSSFRSPRVPELVREGAERANVSAELGDGQRLVQVEMVVDEGRRRFRVNGKPKQPSALAGLLPSVAFTPDDLALAKGGMASRRGALDSLGGQLSANHDQVRRDFEKALAFKNRLLKEDASDGYLDSIDETLALCGAMLSCYRAALFRRLQDAMRLWYGRISDGEDVRGEYLPSWLDDELFDPPEFGRDEARERLRACMAQRRPEERARRRAVVGPHADKVRLLVEGHALERFGSQGQQRSAVLAWKLAEVSVIQDVLSVKPVLLLDDVMSELDERRRRALVEYAVGDMQTFITTANLDYFDASLLDAARVVALQRLEGVTTVV